MKTTLLLLFLFFCSFAVFAQVNSNQWTWMQGDNFIPQHPVYGTKGIAAVSNKLGARTSAVSWTDASGRLWLFGGKGYTNSSVTYLNDLWMYEPASGQWTWMSGDSSGAPVGRYGTKGMAAPANKPGGRNSAVSWTDASGNLWLFGGVSYTSYDGYLYVNDLWRYTPSTGQWTWMSGDNTPNQTGIYGTRGIANSTNKPGARYGAVSWTDPSGNLWLFGGTNNAYDYGGNLNDLWKYTPSTGQWAWISGDSANGYAGVYGTQGVSASTNKPGIRIQATGWTDPSGNLWLFGGMGRGAGYNSGDLNDLWKYAPSTGQWTWMSGDSTGDQKTVYGIKGIAAPACKPGGRFGTVSWADTSGNLWLFGGLGYASSQFGYLNDLWKYAPSTGQWTWAGGDSTYGKMAVYGTRGIASPSNDPGQRYNAVGGMDASGNLWLVSGDGYAPGNNFNSTPGLNDLWKFVPSTGLWTWISGDKAYSNMGIYGTKGIPSPANKPGSRKGSISWTDASDNLWMFGGSEQSLRTLNDLWKYAPSTGQWAWMSGDSAANQTNVYGTQGVAAPANKPGARVGAVSWTAKSGSLWLFSGNNLNDLWKYEPLTGQWTWMSGDTVPGKAVYGNREIAAPANKPGARFGAVSWTDSLNNLWLFGGSGYASNGGGYLNDLWKYTPSIGQWTWMSGDSTREQAGVYGIKGMTAPVNKPGARSDAVSWIDASGNFWLFGGYGYAITFGYQLNDLWKYTPSTGQWTWMSGDSRGLQAGVYGSKGTAAPANKPGARSGAISWTATSGDLYLMGGGGFTSGGNTTGYLNDQWKYSPSTGYWTWISGDNTLNSPGLYGTKGISAPANMPGGRSIAASWIDTSYNLWLFGGIGYSSTYLDILNDLWKYITPAASLPVQFSSFTAYKQQQTVVLNWTTEQEQNSRCFIVERSSGGAVYDSIGVVSASGTVSTASHYFFTDIAPLQGDNFYRLKQLDFDGRLLYSKIVKVHTGEQAPRFTIIQNPVQNMLQLQVQLPAALKLTLQVRDISGHLLVSEDRMGTKGRSVYSLSIDHLASGSYLINVQTENTSITKMFIKQ